MAEAHRGISVFVSATSEDMREYRAVARNVILDMQWHPTMMEHFGACPERTIDACMNVMDECDVVLLLVAFRRGWVPTVAEGGNGIDSITAHELAHARKKQIPVLAILASETWPGNLWEDGADARRWVKDFRAGLNLPAVFFDYEPETKQEAERLPRFRAKLREVLLQHRERLQAQEAAAEAEDSEFDYLESVREGLSEGISIPFLGMGVHGDGPLGAKSLARALAQDSRHEQSSLATAAEYRERFFGSRATFLRTFQRALEERAGKAEAIPVYDMIVRLDNLPMIISTTCDVTLETALDAADLDYVVVAHIVRSFDGEQDGKIVVLRRGAEPEICLADKVRLEKGERVVYKPLGSPFLHEHFDPDLEIDTVVVTETDHLQFLGRLENQHTQIPTAFTRRFQRCPILFLGYDLDVWQYRLVIGVFESVGARGRLASTLAVRAPASAMEAVAWKRLGADLIQMDPNEFAQKMMEEGKP